MNMFQEQLEEHRCWGYEDKGCSVEQRLSTPECPEPSRGWYDCLQLDKDTTM